ncbi:MAG TPA: heparinase II/III family protein, partial [Opitutaceae bacterium]|nr:heparinase II/III family protein [Opitutaceae bacterium]
HGRHPEADRWREAARASLRLYASWQPADGSFGEGIAYWDFTFVHYIFALEVLRRRTGVDDRGLLDFRAQARYALAMTMPTAGHPDDCVNLGDASGAALGAPLAWIAREYRDPVAQYVARRPAAFNPNVLSFWGVAWFDPDVPSPRPTDVPLDTRTELGIVVSRTGWETADNVVVFRCGGPENHEHADRNSVIFKAHGERLFHDPLHAAYATTDPRWLLRQTAAHTAVLVDGRGHIYHDGRDGTNASIAQAQLLDFRTGPQWMATTGDAADAYRRAGLPARMVRRTVVFLKPDVLVLLDRVELDEARPVQARFQVFNEDGAGKTSVAGSAFTISRPGATLRATVTGLAPGHLVAANLPLPAASGVYPYVEYTSDAAAVHEFVTVCTTAPAGGEHGTLAVTRKRDGWSIEGLHRGQMVKLHLGSAAQGVPTVEL